MGFESFGRTAARRVIGLPGARLVLGQLGHQGLMPDALWRRLPAEGDFRVATGNGASFEYRAGPGDHLARPLRWRGLNAWEANNLVVWQRLLHNATVVYDVGANTGVYSLVALACAPNVSVTAFEPLDRIADRAAASIALNGWESRFTMHRVAVSDASGPMEFVDPGSAVPTSARLRIAQYRSTDGMPTTVKAIALDDIEGPRPDLIKIDVEGAEDGVLRGLTTTMSNVAPSIIFECHPEGQVAAIEDLLASHHYRLFHIRTDRIDEVDRLQPVQDRAQNNFAALQRSSALEQITPLC